MNLHYVKFLNKKDSNFDRIINEMNMNIFNISIKYLEEQNIAVVDDGFGQVAINLNPELKTDNLYRLYVSFKGE